MGIIEFFIRRSKVTYLVLVTIFLLGTINMIRTKNSGYPKVDFGMVTITTVYPGASPEDVETKVTSKIEDELKGISGVKYFISSSVENLSVINIFMEDTANYDKVLSDINKEVDQIEDFPAEVTKKPNVEKLDNDRIPVIEVAITGEADYATKRKVALSLEKQLRSIHLVGKIIKLGYFKREVKIEANPKALKSDYVSLIHLMDVIRQNNVRIPGGDLKQSASEKKIVILNEYEPLTSVKNAIVRSGFEGNRVAISDVAIVREGYEPPQKLTRFNAKSAINIQIQKKSDSDILETTTAIANTLKKFKENLPKNVQVEQVVDYSQEVNSLLELVKSNATLGLILVLITLVLFLNIRMAFWTAMGIPVSLLIGFAFFPVFDVTINFISLMAIIIVLGMLVDDAIVIAENIYRYREEGLPPIEASLKGTKEVMWPVLATVSTTIVAFSPLMIMTGVMGKFMYSMPIVITLVLLGSLIESLFFLPSHIAHANFNLNKPRKFRPFKKLEGYYTKVVTITLRHRLITLITFIGTFLFSIVLLTTSMDFVLFDSPDGLYGIVEFEAPRGSSLENTERLAKPIEEIIKKMDKKEISTFVTSIGEKKPLIATFGADVNHSGVGNILIHLTPINSRERTAKTIMKDLREKLKNIKGFTKLAVDVVPDGPPVGKAVTVTFISNNDKKRDRLTQELVTFLESQPGVSKIENNQGIGKKQLQIRFDQNLMYRLGVNPTSAAITIRTAYDGSIVTNIRKDGEEIDFRLSIKEDYKDSVDVLNRLTVPNNEGRLVPIGQFAEITEKEDWLMINHYDGDRAITIYADVDTEKNTSQKVNDQIKKKFLPIVEADTETRLEFGGEEKDTQEAMQSLFIAMVLSLIGIYFILVILFDSFMQPVLVMSAIPFTFTGIVFAFFIHQLTFGFVALIGLIGLMGVVVNNSLIMISFMNIKRDSVGITVESITDAATQRLRPVLLTTLTTAAGLFPTAYSFGGDNAFLVPMIMAIAWGLVFASVITLFLIPAIYIMQNNFIMQFHKFRKKNLTIDKITAKK